MQNVQKEEEFLRYNKPLQIMTLLLCLKKKEELKKPPKFVLIEIFKEIRYLFEDSTILNNDKHQDMLIKWILESENIPKEETKLLYRTDKDGVDSEKFHELCDNKLNTVSIIKASDFIFGGFTSISWKHEDLQNNEFGEDKQDPKSFIFSISNPTNQPTKFSIKNNQYSIICDRHFGPIFGDDIVIYSSLNQGDSFKKSYSNLGCSFEGCPFGYKSDEAKQFLCGSYKFQVQEIEVFQLF